MDKYKPDKHMMKIAQSFGRFRWVIRTNTFPCTPLHSFCSCQDDNQRRLKEKHWDFDMDGLEDLAISLFWG